MDVMSRLTKGIAETGFPRPRTPALEAGVGRLGNRDSGQRPQRDSVTASGPDAPWTGSDRERHNKQGLGEAQEGDPAVMRKECSFARATYESMWAVQSIRKYSKIVDAARRTKRQEYAEHCNRPLISCARARLDTVQAGSPCYRYVDPTSSSLPTPCSTMNLLLCGLKV